MKMQEARAKVAEAILKKFSTSPGEIAYTTRIPLIQIYSVGKKFSDEGLITIEEVENNKIYKVKNQEGLVTVMHSVDDEIALKNDDSAEAKKKLEHKEPITSAGRHTGKFIYNKVAYSKSQCVFMVVSDYVAKHKPTLNELRKVFPDEIVSRFGVVNTLKEAKELSGKTPRYYMKDDQVLTTSDNKKVVVTTQWTLERFLNFSKAAAKVDFKVKAE